jgi:hypothetical protein
MTEKAPKRQDPIERVKAADGDLVLDYNSRIGARPYARFVDGQWDLMSLSYVPTPGYGANDPDAEYGIDTTVHMVDLEPDPDDWDEDELREIAKQRRYPDDEVEGWPGVEVIPYDESPFAHRDEIPARDEIVKEVECNECGMEFRQYIPDPFEECPSCGAELEGADG